jgi:hypothetical protein
MLSRTAVALLFTVSFLPAQEQKPTLDLNWLQLPNTKLEVNGLPWYGENKGEWIRLPLRLKDVVRKEVWDLAQDPTGGRIRFRTDSTALAIRLEYPHAPGMRNMHAFGQSGVDLYADNVYRGTAIATQEAKPGKVIEHVYFNRTGQPRVEREITLYLPLYMPVKVLEIGVDKEARVLPPTPFAVKKPIVFYGTSITQGGCASHPGMAYQAIVGRMLNVDTVNLGFSGNGKGEPEMARAVAEIDASCFVLDFAQNNESVEALRVAYAPFIETLREKYPQTPILANTPIYSASESWGPNPRLSGMRELIRDAVSKKIAAGDRNLQLIEGTNFFGPEKGDGLVDGTHPNDLGFQWMAEAFAARLGKMLGLPAKK